VSLKLVVGYINRLM